MQLPELTTLGVQDMARPVPDYESTWPTEPRQGILPMGRDIVRNETSNARSVLQLEIASCRTGHHSSQTRWAGCSDLLQPLHGSNDGTKRK